MLNLILDEHISPDVGIGLRRRFPKLLIHSMSEWQEGVFLGQEDAVFLQEAFAQRLTLVTYDRRTIPPLLKQWAEEGRSHGGVIFVDDKTIAPGDIGGLVKALALLVMQAQSWHWTDRIVFLRR